MIEDFKEELLSNPTSFICSKWILDRVPFIFNNDRIAYIKWKEELASKLGIDSKAISLTGSSSCGFSLSPTKLFRNFNKHSDIDIAIISELHFNIAWSELRNLGSKQLSLTSKQKNSYHDHKTRLIYWGTIATDQILEILPFGVSWSLNLLEMSNLAPANGRTINIRLYKDYEALRAYQVANLDKIRISLLEKIQTL
ncbi:hypothetical protein [Flavobacterium aquidurense]|uniref:hypothetical protein n=1 Tax=Flavobacterium aquidurense TaxID=362413 RepID=UPI00285FC812|nr:hypothetical protein [Flavobacterium aquidurense]MDR7372274.1 hypothetical protein [Flavobacterium aquidurense]